MLLIYNKLSNWPIVNYAQLPVRVAFVWRHPGRYYVLKMQTDILAGCCPQYHSTRPGVHSFVCHRAASMSLPPAVREAPRRSFETFCHKPAQKRSACTLLNKSASSVMFIIRFTGTTPAIDGPNHLIQLVDNLQMRH